MLLSHEGNPNQLCTKGSLDLLGRLKVLNKFTLYFNARTWALGHTRNGHTSSLLGNLWWCSCILRTSLNHSSLKSVLLAVSFSCWELGRKIFMIKEIYSCYYWSWIVYFGHPILWLSFLFFTLLGKGLGVCLKK